MTFVLSLLVMVFGMKFIKQATPHMFLLWLILALVLLHAHLFPNFVVCPFALTHVNGNILCHPQICHPYEGNDSYWKV
jgi:hypothetical protein